MAPQNAKNKTGYTTALSTQADDAKYKTKYKELKTKLGEIEDDNAKLQLRILKSKKAIQRLRLERAILFDRLQNAAVPSNPYALKTKEHLSRLALPADALPPTIIDEAPYQTLHGDVARTRFLRKLDGRKLLDLVSEADPFGTRPVHGVDASSCQTQSASATPTSKPVSKAPSNGKRKSTGKNSNNHHHMNNNNSQHSTVFVGGGINPSALLTTNSNGLPPAPAGTINPSSVMHVD